jgi:glycosyltransferase involved in cell wall biosynthesis
MHQYTNLSLPRLERAADMTVNKPHNRFSRPKILCIVDGPDWIFRRHVSMLERYLSDEFEFSLCFRNQAYDENNFDLIYPLEYNIVRPEQINNPRKYVTGIRSFVAWADWDFLVLVNYLVTHFRSIHVVSKQLYDIFSPYIRDVQYVTHGVDTAYFSPSTPPSPQPGSLRIGWAGNRSTFVKGFREFIEPLGALPGIELVYCGFADRNLTLEEMPGFYNSIDTYVCASSFEGNNNSLLEAAAMERAIITTAVGTAPEYLENRKNALIVDRDVEQFRNAAIQLRDQPELRLYLGTQARRSLLEKGWDWEQRAKEYRQFFQSALEESIGPLADRVVIEPADYHHYTSVLRLQYQLERDLRIGYATQSNDLNYRLHGIEKELENAYKELEKARDDLHHLPRTILRAVRRRIKAVRRPM